MVGPLPGQSEASLHCYASLTSLTRVCLQSRDERQGVHRKSEEVKHFKSTNPHMLAKTVPGKTQAMGPGWPEGQGEAGSLCTDTRVEPPRLSQICVRSVSYWRAEYVVAHTEKSRHYLKWGRMSCVESAPVQGLQEAA